MNKLKVYLAGSMFTEGEIAIRKAEAYAIREKIDDVDVYNPAEQVFNTNKETLPSPQDIYYGDMNAISNSNVIVVDLGCLHDPGVIAELGFAAGLNQHATNSEDSIYIIGVLSDIRVPSSHKYIYPTWGINHLVLGLIEENGVIVSSFEEAIDELNRINVSR